MANSSLPAKSPTRSTDRGCSDLYQVSGPRGPTWSSVDDAMLRGVCDGSAGQCLLRVDYSRKGWRDCRSRFCESPGRLRCTIPGIAECEMG